MWTKISTVLNYLGKTGFVTEPTGQTVKQATKAELLGLINVAREIRGLPEESYPGLNRKLKSPSEQFKRQINVALGLEDLGLDINIWSKSDVTIVNEIKTMREGGVLNFAASLPQHDDFLRISHTKPQGFRVNDPNFRRSKHLKETEVVYSRESKIRIEIAMPFEGHVRICGFEDGEFFGLNEECSITYSRLPRGLYTSTESLELTPTVPRTSLMAFACKENVFDNWPTSAIANDHIPPNVALELIGEFAELPETSRAQKMLSFITV